MRRKLIAWSIGLLIVAVTVIAVGRFGRDSHPAGTAGSVKPGGIDTPQRQPGPDESQSIEPVVPDPIELPARLEQTPPIILITVDTLRADFLGCYGHANETSPHLDRFAESGVRFENCYSQAPVTSSSCASILTGFLPHETSVFSNNVLPPRLETLPEILQRCGYTTVGVTCNYNLRALRGWSQGFDVFDDEMQDEELVRGFAERIAEHATDRILELIEEHRDDQLFAWVHYQDPHGPYTPPREYVPQFWDKSRPKRPLTDIPDYQRLGDLDDYHAYVAHYEAEIRYFDDHFQRLLDGLREFDLFDDALIVFTADHGEGMGERGYYFAHFEKLHRGILHVPLILRYGDQLSGARSEFVQHLDVVPTILGVLGIERDERFRGSDLLQPIPTGRVIFSENLVSALGRPDERMCSVIVDGIKLGHSPISGRYELFDVLADRDEEQDLYGQSPQDVSTEELQRELQRIRDENRLGVRIVTEQPPLTEEERRHLRSLGYVD